VSAVISAMLPPGGPPWSARSPVDEDVLEALADEAIEAAVATMPVPDLPSPGTHAWSVHATRREGPGTPDDAVLEALVDEIFEQLAAVDAMPSHDRRPAPWRRARGLG
jgi:hypothetical protein